MTPPIKDFMKIEKKYKCTECGSKNVFYSIMVDQKQNEFGGVDFGYCYDCPDDISNEKLLESIIVH